MACLDQLFDNIGCAQFVRCASPQVASIAERWLSRAFETILLRIYTHIFGFICRQLVYRISVRRLRNFRPLVKERGTKPAVWVRLTLYVMHLIELSIVFIKPCYETESLEIQNYAFSNCDLSCSFIFMFSQQNRNDISHNYSYKDNMLLICLVEYARIRKNIYTKKYRDR